MLSRLLSDTGLPSLLASPLVALMLKATLILLAAYAVTRLMQRSAAGARHLVWFVALAAMLVVPAVSVWSPLRLEVLPPARVSSVGPVLAGGDGGARVNPDALLANAQSEVASEPAVSALATRSGAVDAPDASLVTRFGVLPIAVAIWAGVAMLVLVSLAWSAFLVRRIVRRATPLASDDWSVPLWEIADRLGLDEVPRLLRAADGKMPFACGVLRATIVLPADCDAWSLDRRRVVLLHELAHVRRHDLLGHTLGRIACAVWWFHPLVWTAARELRAESERACDDLALSCGTRATDYAEHLLDIVTAVRRDATPQVALAMARRKEFEGRMLAILDPQLERVGPGRLQSAALAASLVVVALLVGAAAPVPRSVEAMAAEPQRPWTAATGAGETEIDSLGMLEKKQKPTKAAQAQAASEAQAEARAAAEEQSASSISPERLRAMVLGGKQGKSQGSDDRPALLARVLRTDRSAELRRIAAWGLGEYGETPVGTEALAAALRNDEDERVREMAAWALGESGADGSVASEALAAALRGDASEKVRGTAAWAIGEAGVRNAGEALVAALSDNSAGVRKRVIWAMGEIGMRQAPQRLIEMLKDREPEIREITAWALYEIEDADAAPALQAALAVEQDKDLQLAYIRALAVLGEKSVDAIRGLLESSDPRIKAMAVRALAGGDAAGPWPWPWPEPRPYP